MVLPIRSSKSSTDRKVKFKFSSHDFAMPLLITCFQRIGNDVKKAWTEFKPSEHIHAQSKQ